MVRAMITIHARVLTPVTVSCAEGRISAEKRAEKLERAARLEKLEKAVKRAKLERAVKQAKLEKAVKRAKLERAARLAKREKVVKRARAAKEGPVCLAVALPTREQAAMKPVVKAVSVETIPTAVMSLTI